MDDLATCSLVQALPPELFNTIYDLTFSVNVSPSKYTITENFKPPACLQVNHASRQKLVESYYRCTIFYINEVLLYPWLRSLDADHIRRVRELRITETITGPLDVKSSDLDPGEAQLAFVALWRITGRVGTRGPAYGLVANRLKLGVLCGDSGETEWVGRGDVAKNQH